MQLKTGVFWTAPRSAQVGIDPRVGVSLAGLDVAELRLIDSLTRPQTEAEITARAKAAGVAPRRLRSVLAMLERAGVLDMDPSPAPDAIAHKRIYGQAPDREGRHVHIERADYLGAGIAIGLARCGIGKITTDDDAPITFYDHPDMRRLGVGYGREGALKTLLRHAHPRVATGRRRSTVPDLVVVTGTYATDPVLVGQYVADDVPVYQAWVEEVDIYAGPMTIPHETPCGNCLMLHRETFDPNWRTIIQQACSAPPLMPDNSSAMMAISLAVRDITEAFDTGAVPDMWRIGPSPSPPEQLVLAPHPDCGCTLTPAPDLRPEPTPEPAPVTKPAPKPAAQPVHTT
ncbi:hypothetical protein [Trueperella bialowiezensis]|uniref:Bacteriocin biosynthesis cyclodehydratase domain n=1 Tax=Trueperella bialowiezensis TaxID=312285 RepID=A0A448PFW4_9ACTO|nr:hypothetical protein [Trueperella bialowiezensis]VEI13793.1 Uncharacterised protein [Trueperella bialowiezensis]